MFCDVVIHLTPGGVVYNPNLYNMLCIHFAPSDLAPYITRHEVHDLLNYGFDISEEDKNALINNGPTRTKQLDQLRFVWSRFLRRKNCSLETKSRKLKSLLRMGIPPEYRGIVWYHISGAKKLDDANPNMYEYLETQPVNPTFLSWISKDVPRTYPSHPFFLANQGQLTELLVQYSKLRPDVGYKAGMNVVAGLLLIYMPPRRAIYVLDVIMTKLLAHLEPPGLAVELATLDRLMQKRCTRVYEHLETYLGDNIPQLFAVKWILCIFADSNFPMETVFRIWDAFLNEGNKVSLRVILALMMTNEDQILSVTGFQPLLTEINDAARRAVNADELLGRGFKILNLSTSSIVKLRNSI